MLFFCPPVGFPITPPSFHLQHFQTDPLASKLYDDCVAVDWRLCTPDFQLQSALKRSSLDDRISLFSVLCSVWFEGVQTYISVSKRTTRQKEILLWRPLELLLMYNVCKNSPQDASARPTRYTPHVCTEVALTTSSHFFSSFYHFWNIVNVKSWRWKGWSKKKKGLMGDGSWGEEQEQEQTVGIRPNGLPVRAALCVMNGLCSLCSLHAGCVPQMYPFDIHSGHLSTLPSPPPSPPAAAPDLWWCGALQTEWTNCDWRPAESTALTSLRSSLIWRANPVYLIKTDWNMYY